MADIVFEDGGVLVPVVVDVTSEERHRARATVTELAVERGASISDHMRSERDVLELDVTITDTPLFFRDATEPLTRTKDTWAQLLDARDRQLLATVTTPLRTYESMVLVEASTTRGAADSTWIRAALTFAEVRLVATQYVDDPTPARARDRREVDVGSQSTKPASEQVRSGLARGLDSAVDGVRGLFQ